MHIYGVLKQMGLDLIQQEVTNASAHWNLKLTLFAHTHCCKPRPKVWRAGSGWRAGSHWMDFVQSSTDPMSCMETCITAHPAGKAEPQPRALVPLLCVQGWM